MRRQPLSSSLDRWDTRFGFFRYHDREIVHESADDRSRRAEALATAGINAIITFSRQG
jgi:hypothetical protein